MHTANVLVILAAAAAVVVGGCSSKPTAMSVCQKIEASGVGAKCHEEKPGGLGAAAVERAEFELPSVPGKGGSVLRFDREEFYTTTEDSYGKLAMVAGPHRYGSKKALVFVQMNEGLSLADGKKVKAIVDGL